MLVLLEGASAAPSNVDLGWFLILGHMELLNGLICLGALDEAFEDRGLEHARQLGFLERASVPPSNSCGRGTDYIARYIPVHCLQHSAWGNS